MVTHLQNQDAWSLRGARVLVTGAAGLLGPWLIEQLLQQDAQVYALVRDIVPSSLLFCTSLSSRVNVIFGDINDMQLCQRVMNECEIDTVFHLGAQALVGVANRDPISTFQSNIVGTWNVLEACRLAPWVKRIVVASSDKAYGEHPVLPYTEACSLQGRHPYDVSKSCADLIAQCYATTYKLPVCVTRCGNFFGGGDLHFSRIVPGTIRSLVRGEQPIIRSSGLFVRDYVYVKDVANAYIQIAQQMHRPDVVGQCFNISTDAPYTVLQVVEQITAIMGVAGCKPQILNQASNEIPAQHLDSTKARMILGWQPAYGVRKGLEETVAWYKNFFTASTQSLGQLDIPMQRAVLPGARV